MFTLSNKEELPSATDALPGRDEEMPVVNRHVVLDRPIKGPFSDDLEQIILGMGCFWGAERKFWELPGVYTTAVGYSAGFTPNPTYQEVCSGLTGHNEVVLVVYKPTECSLDKIIRVFFESHNPTQGMRQGNDRGTQYRSGVYYLTDKQKVHADTLCADYQKKLTRSGYGLITTEIKPAAEFYYAEDYHQQYLAKNPNGYCGLGGTGVNFD